MSMYERSGPHRDRERHTSLRSDGAGAHSEMHACTYLPPSQRTYDEARRRVPRMDVRPLRLPDRPDPREESARESEVRMRERKTRQHERHTATPLPVGDRSKYYVS